MGIRGRNASRSDGFDQMLEEVKSWCCKVESTLHSGEPEFPAWFMQHLGQVMKENVIAPIRQIAGLGATLEFYTQNVAECCNNMMKGDADTKNGLIFVSPSKKLQSNRNEK